MKVRHAFYPLWPADYGVASDHCQEVLAGSYDVPFNPATPPVILDVGANIGAFVLWSVERWPGCTIHAYEPHPNNFALLQRTVADFAPGEKVTCYNVAVGAQSGTERMANPGVNCGEWCLTRADDEKRETITVEVISAATLPKADILKIDVEGLEIEILATFDEERSREFSAIMLEVHCADWIEPLTQKLKQFGFTLTKSNRLFHHRCEMNFVKSKLLKP